MNVLVTGSSGQLGSEMKALSTREGKLRFFCHDLPELDITDKESVGRVCSHHNIAAIVNCAAYTAVDKAEEETGRAFHKPAAAYCCGCY